MEQSKSSEDVAGKSVTSFRTFWSLSKNQHRQFVEDKRDLLTSLDELDQADLSAQLYGAHRLKRRLYHTSPEEFPSSGVPGAHSATQHAKTEQYLRQYENWGGSHEVPYRRSWTAWPLGSGNVPRTQQELNFPHADSEGSSCAEAEDAFHKQPATFDYKQSYEMEEALLGEMLKVALKSIESYRGGKFEIVGVGDGRQVNEDGRKASRATKEAGSNSHSGNNSKTYKNDSTKPGTSKCKGIDTGTKQAEDWPRPRSRSANKHLYGVESGSEITSEPYGQTEWDPMSDDEEAKRILWPSIRHVLQTLDTLLMGLHRSRQNHTEPGDSSDTADHSENSEKHSSASRSGTDTDGSKAKFRKREASDTNAVPNTLRDWREVLGTASATGWDTEVVSRASLRCSELFSQKLQFHRLDGDAFGMSKETGEAGTSIRSGVSSPGGRGMFGGVHNDNFLEPIAGQRGWREKSKREHSKGRKDKHSKAHKRTMHNYDDASMDS